MQTNPCTVNSCCKLDFIKFVGNDPQQLSYRKLCTNHSYIAIASSVSLSITMIAMCIGFSYATCNYIMHVNWTSVINIYPTIINVLYNLCSLICSYMVLTLTLCDFSHFNQAIIVQI